MQVTYVTSIIDKPIINDNTIKKINVRYNTIYHPDPTIRSFTGANICDTLSNVSRKEDANTIAKLPKTNVIIKNRTSF